MDKTKDYILLVEDDDNIADTMAMVLHAEGFSVERARNCAEARAVFKKRSPSVILLDYILEGETPDCFVDYVREVQDDKIPIILVTAATIKEGVAEALRIKTIVRKPFPIETLLQAIHDYVS